MLLRKLHLESNTKTKAMTGALHTTTTTTTTTQQVPIVTSNTQQIAFETVSKLLSNTRSLSTIKRSPQATGPEIRLHHRYPRCQRPIRSVLGRHERKEYKRESGRLFSMPSLI